MKAAVRSRTISHINLATPDRSLTERLMLRAMKVSPLPGLSICRSFGHSFVLAVSSDSPLPCLHLRDIFMIFARLYDNS
jgi:hypothetical protein